MGGLRDVLGRKLDKVDEENKVRSMFYFLRIGKFFMYDNFLCFIDLLFILLFLVGLLLIINYVVINLYCFFFLIGSILYGRSYGLGKIGFLFF